MNPAHRALPRLLLLAALLATGALAPAVYGCSADEASSGASLPPDTSLTGPYQEGLALFERHELRAAAESFALVTLSPTSPDLPEAQVGLVLTELLLTPERGAAAHLISQLGGQPVQVERDLLGNDGILALLAAHTDELELERRLDDALPWTADQLQDPGVFFDGTPEGTTADDLADTLAELAGELMRLADTLEGAADHPDFSEFTLRGAAFHARTTLRLTRPEVLLLASTLRLSASTLLWISAYAWPLDLRQALGSSASLDERVARFNAAAFRALRPQADERLRAAQDQLQSALINLRVAITEGGANPVQGNLRWGSLRGDEIDALSRILDALLAATSELAPSTLPFSTPPDTRLDLRPLFTGRTLPPERALLIHRVDEFGDGTWELDPESVRVLWLDGVLDPACTPSFDAADDAEADACPQLFDAPALSEDTVERVADPFFSSVEADYNLQ